MKTTFTPANTIEDCLEFAQIYCDHSRYVSVWELEGTGKKKKSVWKGTKCVETTKDVLKFKEYEFDARFKYCVCGHGVKHVLFNGEETILVNPKKYNGYLPIMKQEKI